MCLIKSPWEQFNSSVVNGYRLIGGKLKTSGLAYSIIPKFFVKESVSKRKQRILKLIVNVLYTAIKIIWKLTK